MRPFRRESRPTNAVSILSTLFNPLNIFVQLQHLYCVSCSLCRMPQHDWSLAHDAVITSRQYYVNCTGYSHPRAHQVQSGMPVLVRQSLSGQARLYLADDCCFVSDSTQRSLRSADVPTCVVPRTLSSYGDRTFAAAGPRLWNSIPIQLRNPDITYGLLRRQLKAHLCDLFRKAWTLWRSVTFICGALEEHLLTYLLIYKNSSGDKNR